MKNGRYDDQAAFDLLQPELRYTLSWYNGGPSTITIVWAGLDMLADAHYITRPADLQEYLDETMQGIRGIMANHSDYSFLNDLKSYYKSTVVLHSYADDFSDSFNGLTAKLEGFEEDQITQRVDFEFIFDASQKSIRTF